MTCLRSLFSAITSLSLAAACAPASPGDQESALERDEALRGGVIADGEHPEVGIITSKAGYCTGTLIGPRTVLTAAHCFDFSSGIGPETDPPFGTFNLVLTNNKALSVPYHRYRADAWIIQVGFDMGVAQLDWPVSSDGATPAAIAEAWPEDGDTLTVYGYGRYGEDCDARDAGPKHKRKDVIELPDGFWHRVTCPGDSGGPYFWTGTNQIVAVVKGDGLGVEWVGDVVAHRDWVLEQLAASENGELAPE